MHVDSILYAKTRAELTLQTTAPVHEAILDRLEYRRGSLVRMILMQQSLDIEFLLERLDGLQKTAHLASHLHAAFNDKQYRKMSIAAPVRQVAVLTLDEALTDLRDMYAVLGTQRHFICFGAAWQSPPALRLLLQTLASRKRRPHVLARAVLQNQLFAQGGPLEGPESTHAYILAELGECCFPDDALADGAFWTHDWPARSVQMRVRERLDRFVHDAAGPILDVLRALCQNHCRMRRCLVNCLPGFDKLADADVHGEDALAYLEHALHDAATLRKWHTATLITQLGFEHDLYQAYELPAVHLHLRSHFHTQQRILSSQQQRLSAENKPPAPFSPPRASARGEKHAYLNTLREHARAGALAASAFHHVFALLQRVGLLEDAPPRSLTAPALQHELRGREYATVPGDVPGQATFAREARCEGVQRARVLDEADRMLGEARALMLECVKIADPACRAALGRAGELDVLWKEDATRVVRSVVEMKLFVGRVGGVLREVDDGAGADADIAALIKGRVEITLPEVDKRTHAWWVVPQITIKK